MDVPGLTATRPFWFCAFQSIELSLKAYLRGFGETKESLKSDFGHDVTALYESAVSAGLPVNLEADELNALILAGTKFREKVFQFREAGWMNLPFASVALTLAQKLFDACRPYAEANVARHHGKSLAVTPRKPRGITDSKADKKREAALGVQ